MTVPKVTYLSDYRPSNFLIETVFLHFDLQEEKTTVKSILKIRRNPAQTAGEKNLILDGEDLELLSLELDGKPLTSSEYQCDEKQLVVYAVPDNFVLETKVIIHPEKNTQLMGLYKSRHNFCTQCEAEGFRRITYFLDRPDILTYFSTTITANKNKYPYLLSNGNLIESRDLDEHRHWVHWQDPSLKPCYLFALVAGDFDVITDHFITCSRRDVVLKLYLEKGFKDQGDFAMQALKKAMRWDEEKFGREYDLDIYMTVAVSDFNMGAMENKGLNIFNTKYVLAKPQTATDNDYIAIENVIGHEYFHNWTGNRVTCRDWFQLTLKEGLTVLRDQLFVEDITSAAVARIQTADQVRTEQFLEDASPMAHPIRPISYLEINNFYTKTVYRKGAEVLRMVRTLLSPETFRQGMDLYFYRHDGQAVTTDNFLQAMQDASHKDLTQFKNWYEQAGTPLLTIEGVYRAEEKTFTLTVQQTCPATPGQPEKKPFHLPLTIGLLRADGTSIPLQREGQNIRAAIAILEVTAQKQTFTFQQVEEKPVPSLLRGFSAPVKLHYPYSDAELALLWQHDSDAFARWDAGLQLFIRVMKEKIERNTSHFSGQIESIYLTTFEKLLTQPVKGPDYLSCLLTLPSLSYLLANVQQADVGVLHQARELVKKHLATQLMDYFHQEYEKNKALTYVYNEKETGKRALKNCCLCYLTATGEPQYFALAYQQFVQADNMTDALSALVALNHYDCHEREQALTEFYQRWQQDPLVVNKWFALQASSTLPNTLEKVTALMIHPAFNIRNPNNVYALIGGLTANIAIFHQPDGLCYRFLADQVLQLDTFNPQVAARMLLPLTHCDQVDQGRAEKMQQQLKRIAQSPELSPDVYEIVSKSVLKN